MPDTMAYDVGAIIAYLSADATVAALVSGRIWGDEMPPSEAVSMPRKCVIINTVGQGGYGRESRSEIAVDMRMKDVRCYGETPYEARRIYDAVNLALKRLRRHLVTPPAGLGQVLLYSAVKVAGPTSRREPDTEWPIAFGTYNFTVADTVA